MRTKLSGDEDYDHFLNRMKGNRLAMKVKLFDLVDNLDTSRIEDPTDSDLKRSKKYARAYAFIKKTISKL